MESAAEPLAGYEREQLLSGPPGEVWQARDPATGERVVLRLGRERLQLERVRSAAAAWAALRSAHLIGLRAAVPVPTGWALVSDYAAGGSLAAVLSARPTLTTGEVITIGVPLAETLAELHRAGLWYGELHPANVLFTATGRPMLDLPVRRLLAGAGVAPAPAATGEPAVRADVMALVGLCRAMLPSPAAQPLLAALDDAGARPAAGGGDPGPALHLAAALAAAGRPVPVRLAALPWSTTGGPPGPPVIPARSAAARRAPRPAHRRRRPRLHGFGTAAGALVAAGLAVLGGIGWTAHDGGSAVPDPLPTAVRAGQRSAAPHRRLPPAVPAGSAGPQQPWAPVVAALDRRRDAGFASLDETALRAVYLPGSPPLRSELAALRRLRSMGVHAEGLDLRVERVVPVSVAARLVVLEVLDRLPAYDLVGADGRRRAHREARAEQRWRLRLVRTGVGWRIEAVTALSAGLSGAG